MRRSTTIFSLAVLLSLMLPLGYAASEGPAVWLAYKQVISRQSVDRAYRPLMLLGREFPQLDYVRYRYHDLFLPPPTVCGPPPRRP